MRTAIRSSRLFGHLLAALLLIIILSIFYRDVVFGGRTFLLLNGLSGTLPTPMGSVYGYSGSPSDTFVADPANAWVNEPYQRRIGKIFASGEVPLWNPNSGLGGPLLADGNAAPFEPLQLLLALVPDQYWPLAVDIQVLARFFLAGFFTYLFVRSLGLSFVPGVLAGAAFMLSSYFVLFGNHPQMKAEILLPVALYGYERLSKQLTFPHLLFGAAATAWVIIASFPESGFLVLGFASIWYTYRSFWQAWDAKFARPMVLRLMAQFILTAGVGLALSAFVMLPLVENILASVNVHDTSVGLKSLPATASILTLMPRVQLGLVIWTHFYTTVITLALIGVAAGLKTGTQRRVIGFFGVYAIVLYLKIFGFALVQWIGHLPGFNQVLLNKYTVPSISLSLAILAAFGAEAIIRRAISFRMILFVLAGFFVPVAYIATIVVRPPQMDPHLLGENARLVLGVIAVVCVTALLIKRFNTKSAYLAPILLVLIAIEPPLWHEYIRRPVRYDPFTTPPFITFLRSQSKPYRVLGFDDILFPDIATAYDVDDARSIPALAPIRRFLFINEFVTPGSAVPKKLMKSGTFFSTELFSAISHSLSNPDESDSIELGDKVKFQGGENPIYLGKFIDLLNTSYFLTRTDQHTIASIDLADLPGLADLLNQPPVIEPQDLGINGDLRRAIFMQTPARAVLPMLLPAGKVSLDFGIGLDPENWSKATGTGVEYRVVVTDQQGEHEMFRHYLDPKQSSPNHGWIDASVDLSRWSGQRVELTLATSAGPGADAQSPKAYWSSPILRIHPEPSAWALERVKQVNHISLNTALLEQNRAKADGVLQDSTVTIGNDKRSSILMNPDNYADVAVRVPGSLTELKFAMGMDPQVWEKEPVGDGVRFRITVLDGTKEQEIFSRYIDPKHHPKERRWMNAKLVLSAWHGRSITLRFVVDAGPRDDGREDQAHWANIELTGVGVGAANPELARFELVYDKEIQIYRNNFAYPRAFVVHNVVQAHDPDDAIRRLAQTNVNPSTQAVVEGEPANWDRALFAGNAPPASPARVVQRTVNTMVITTTIDKPGMLVVSNTFNRGWQVYVDGTPTSVLPVDVFLQGVYLPAGAHEIRLVYWPWSFTLGVTISISTLLILISIVVARQLRRRNS